MVLLVCVDGSASDAQADAMRVLASRLADGPLGIAFVDRIEPDDPPLRTAGFEVHLPDADEPGARRQLAVLVDTISDHARDHDLALVVEDGTEAIGVIEGDGVKDAQFVAAIFGAA